MVLTNHPVVERAADRLLTEFRPPRHVAAALKPKLVKHLRTQPECCIPASVPQASWDPVAKSAHASGQPVYKWRLCTAVGTKVRKDLKWLMLALTAQRRGRPRLEVDAGQTLEADLSRMNWEGVGSRLAKYRSLVQRAGKRTAQVRQMWRPETVEIVPGQIEWRLLTSAEELREAGGQLGNCIGCNPTASRRYQTALKERVSIFWVLEEDGEHVGLLAAGRATLTVEEASGRNGMPLHVQHAYALIELLQAKGYGAGDSLLSLGITDAVVAHKREQLAEGMFEDQPYVVSRYGSDELVIQLFNTYAVIRNTGSRRICLIGDDFPDSDAAWSIVDDSGCLDAIRPGPVIPKRKVSSARRVLR
jgi:hypothetical protein